ncbi:uncharacterized protein METZ01_LOCUS366493 [marine metagenome]|uniref:Uncharacterized protein n=1 Tax=marine metagenome TaxID=408172 RepID=A0A382SUQ1_9ZZZZ
MVAGNKRQKWNHWPTEKYKGKNCKYQQMEQDA